MRQQFRFCPETLHRIRTLAKGGRTATQIAETLGGCTAETIRAICAQHGYDLVEETAAILAERLTLELRGR